MRNRGGIIAQVFPFSFKEFVSYFECKDLQQAFDMALVNVNTLRPEQLSLAGLSFQ